MCESNLCARRRQTFTAARVGIAIVAVFCFCVCVKHRTGTGDRIAFLACGCVFCFFLRLLWFGWYVQELLCVEARRSRCVESARLREHVVV